MHWKSKR